MSVQNFAALVFVGPGPQDVRRLGELLDSIACYEPDIAHVVVIDDASGIDFPAVVPAQLRGRVVALPNPRNRQGDWWQGGLCVGLTTGLKWLAENAPESFVVRLDTDALVIAPFAERVARRLAAQPEAGLLGTFALHSRNGSARLPKTDMAPFLTRVIQKSCLPLAVWRHSQWPTRVQCVLRKRDRTVARMIRRAIRNGYRMGDFVQGGGYALSGELVRRLAHEGYLNDPLGYLWQFYSEDVLATLLCYAAGLVPGDFNQTGDVFAVAWSHLPGHPEELLADGFAIVHSIKNGPTTEAETLEYFRTVRRSAPRSAEPVYPGAER